MESLLLFRRALSSPTMCRLIPALSVPHLPRISPGRDVLGVAMRLGCDVALSRRRLMVRRYVTARYLV